jgi:FeS assembly SUF system protein
MNRERLPLPMDGPSAPPPLPAPPPGPPLEEPLTGEQIVDLKDRIVRELHTCFDPEIPVNIYELGLIYDITITPAAEVNVRMTLTTPMCPAAGSLPGEVEVKVRNVKPVTAAKVELVWDPPWNKDRMSEAAKLQLGIDD